MLLTTTMHNDNAPVSFIHLVIIEANFYVAVLNIAHPVGINGLGVVVLKDLLLAVDGVNQIDDFAVWLFDGGGKGGQGEIGFAASRGGFDNIQLVLL